MGATKLADIGEEWRFYDVIGIDEGQFFEDVRKNSIVIIFDERSPYSVSLPQIKER